MDHLKASPPDSPPKRSLRRDVLLSTVTQTAVAATTFAQYAIIQRTWGTEALANYSLLMRARGVLEWIVLLMLPVALARELACHPGSAQQSERQALIRAGGLIAISGLAACLALFTFAPRLSGLVLFGSEDLAVWMTPFALLLAGFSLCLISSAIARGEMAFAEVNVIQLLYVAVVPIAAMLLGRHGDLRHVVMVIGAAAVLIAVVSYARHLRQAENALDLRRAAGRLVGYGAPRLTTMGAVFVHTMCLPWLVSWRSDAPVLAALNALLGVVSAGALLVSPIGLVMLPHLSRLRAEGALEQVNSQVSRLVQATLLAGGLGSLGALALLPSVVSLWLGPEVAAHTPLLLACALAVPAYLLTEIVRNPIDAASRRPWNALTYLAGAAAGALVFFAVERASGNLTVAAAAGLVAGMGCAATGALVIVRRFHRLAALDRCVRRAMIAWSGAVTVSSATLFLVPPAWHLVFGVCLTLGFVLLVLRQAPAWLLEIVPERWRRIVQKVTA